MFPMTQHAQSRCKQRGIPPTVVEHLLDFGHEIHDHHGSFIVYFDRRARARLRSAFGTDQFKRMESHLNTYAVISDDGAVVTVGHRYRRIHHWTTPSSKSRRTS